MTVDIRSVLARAGRSLSLARVKGFLEHLVATRPNEISGWGGFFLFNIVPTCRMRNFRNEVSPRYRGGLGRLQNIRQPSLELQLQSSVVRGSYVQANFEKG